MGWLWKVTTQLTCVSITERFVKWLAFGRSAIRLIRLVGWFVVVHRNFLESSKSKNIINLMSHYDESRWQTTEGTQLFSRLGNMNCLQSNNYENEYWIKILKVHLVIWFHLRKFSIVFNYGMDNNELVRNKNVLFVINDRHLPEIIRSLNVDPKTLIFLFQSARKMI